MRVNRQKTFNSKSIDQMVTSTSPNQSGKGRVVQYFPRLLTDKIVGEWCSLEKFDPITLQSLWSHETCQE